MGSPGQSLSDRAYEIVKEKIFNSGKDEYIGLREMVKELDMSYTPVREAFQRLEREGFLKLVPKVGYFVSKLDIEEIIRIYQARECLELFVFDKVFDSICDEHVETLKHYVHMQIETYKNGDYRQYYKNDECFHKLFFKIYNNNYLTSMIENLREKRFMGSKKTINELKEQQIVEAIEEHKELIRNIQNRDKEEAAKMLAAHIENSKNRVKDGYLLFE